jgi:hypothetical protein
MSALKSANKELKGMMKTVKIQDIDVRNLFWFQAPPPLLSYLFGFSIEVSKE